MEEEIFRKKSLEQLDKHEELDAYLKVARPTVWVSLGLIVIILCGLLTWGFLGRLEIKIRGVCEVVNNRLTNYIKEDLFVNVKVNQQIRFNDKSCLITSIGERIKVSKDSEEINQYVIEKGGFLIGEYVYPCYADIDVSDGYYLTDTVTGSIAPLSYVFR